jgi:hypothetical protein
MGQGSREVLLLICGPFFSLRSFITRRRQAELARCLMSCVYSERKFGSVKGQPYLTTASIPRPAWC